MMNQLLRCALFLATMLLGAQSVHAAAFACHVILENNSPYIQLVESKDKVGAMALAGKVKARLAPNRRVPIKRVVECIAGPQERFADPKIDAQFRSMPF